VDGVAEEDLVVPRGRSRTLAFARDASAIRPAKDFLDTQTSDRERVQFFLYFTLLAEEGRIANVQKFRKERGNIWGFKVSDARIASFSRGRVWCLTHGFRKKRDRWPANEIARAERIRWEHLLRSRELGDRES
jgi:hypothetical protein